MRLRTVDAFTDRPFTGNPAAVVVLNDAAPNDWMAALARELNLPETAFVIRETSSEADLRLRWFTPAVEIDLCGHATLAAAHCLFEDGISGPIRFATRSGVLTVSHRPDGSLAMDFPACPPSQIDTPAGISDALRVTFTRWGEAVCVVGRNPAPESTTHHAYLQEFLRDRRDSSPRPPA